MSEPETSTPMLDGAIVTIVSRPGKAAGDEPWRAAVPAFRDEALFREYRDLLEARRREAIPEEDPGA